MSKILVIHPKDETTDFLCDIYKDLKCTVINKPITESALKLHIKFHDRIIMLGHGDRNGLYGFGNFVITPNFIPLLKGKECVAIWCNADVFFKKHGLTGIFSGMIISDYNEAFLFCQTEFEQSQIDRSNLLFAKAVKESILVKDCVSKYRSLYHEENNPIVAFNSKNYYVTPDSNFTEDNGWNESVKQDAKWKEHY